MCRMQDGVNIKPPIVECKNSDVKPVQSVDMDDESDEIPLLKLQKKEENSNKVEKRVEKLSSSGDIDSASLVTRKENPVVIEHLQNRNINEPKAATKKVVCPKPEEVPKKSAESKPKKILGLDVYDEREIILKTMELQVGHKYKDVPNSFGKPAENLMKQKMYKKLLTHKLKGLHQFYDRRIN